MQFSLPQGAAHYDVNPRLSATQCFHLGALLPKDFGCLSVYWPSNIPGINPYLLCGDDAAIWSILWCIPAQYLGYHNRKRKEPGGCYAVSEDVEQLLPWPCGPGAPLGQKTYHKDAQKYFLCQISLRSDQERFYWNL